MKWLLGVPLAAVALVLTPIIFLGVVASGGVPGSPTLQTDGSGTVSKAEFAAAVLADLGAPESESNVGKLTVWFQHESGGGGGDWNPLDYVTPTAGSTPFNTAGVQNYPDVATGVAMTSTLLQQGNTAFIAGNLLTDGDWHTYLKAVADFNQPWTPQSWRDSLQAATPDEAKRYEATPVNGKVVSPVVGASSTGLKLVLAAMLAIGIPYADGNPDKGDPGIQFSGHPGDIWVNQHFGVQDQRYSTLDCSGLLNAAMFLAFKLALNYCSADYLHDPRFTPILMDQLQTGDIVIKGTSCGPEGHIAIVAAASGGVASTIDAARHGTVVGFRAAQSVTSWQFTAARRYTG